MKTFKKVLAVVLVLALAVIALPGMKAKAAAIEYTTDEVFAYAADEYHGITTLNSTTPSWKNYAWIKFNAESDTIQLDLDVLAQIDSIEYIFTGEGSFSTNVVRNTKAAGGWATEAATIEVSAGNDFTYVIAGVDGAAAAAEAATGDRYFNFCLQTTSDITGEVSVKAIVLKDANGGVVINITNPAFAAADVVPTTGDTAPVVIIAAAAVVALCGMAVVNRKKAYR